MTFRLVTVLYLFALLAASLAVFGVWGILVAAVVYGIWASRHRWRLVRIAVATLVVAFVVALVIPYFIVDMASGRRPRSLNNIKQITFALQQYHSTHGSFPPPVIVDDNGTPLYSWRVAILPYLGQSALYKKLHLDEPWDSPHNKNLLADNEVFMSPAVGDSHAPVGICSYFAVVGPETVWQPGKSTALHQVYDGANQTITVIEVDGDDVRWTEPRDITVDEAVSLLTGRRLNRFNSVSHGYFESHRYAYVASGVGYVDGHAHIFPPLAHAEDALALLTRAGRERVVDDPDTLAEVSRVEHVETIIHWDHIWGVAVWLALVLLPAVPAARRKIWPSEDAVEEQPQVLEEILEH